MSNSDVTPLRKTYIRFDVAEQVFIEPGFWMDRWYSQVRKRVWADDTVTSSNVQYSPRVGWRLETWSYSGGSGREISTGEVTMNVPSGYANLATWAKSDQSGVTYNGAVQATGDKYYTRQVAAPDSLGDPKYNLASDQAAFPCPVTANASMQRTATSTGQLVGDIIFSFVPPGHVRSSNDYIHAFTFNGPRGWKSNPGNWNNTGHYALAYRGNGFVDLFVYLTNGSTQKWQSLRRMMYCVCDQVTNHVQRTFITVTEGSNPKISGGILTFRFSMAPLPKEVPSGAYMALTAWSSTSDADLSAYTHSVATPGVSRSIGAPTYPSRVDTRQDVNSKFQVVIDGFLNSGKLVDASFDIPFIPDGSAAPFVVDFFSDIPTGTTLKCAMYAVTSVAQGTPPSFTALTLASGGGNSGSSFLLISGVRTYCVAFTYTGDSTLTSGGTVHSALTPVLHGYRVIRAGHGTVVAPGEFSPSNASAAGKLRSSSASNVSITLADNNPETSMATVHIDDFNGDCLPLQQRGDFPTIISTDFWNGTSNVNVILHRGYAQMPSSEEVGNHQSGWATGFSGTGGIQTFNYKYRYRVDVTIAGAWQRLHEQVIKARLNLAIDGVATGVIGPPKVTDVVTWLFSLAGYSSNMLNIPDLAIRIFPNADGDQMVLEPQSNISDVIVRLLKDYLGAYLYFEPNLGTYGMWSVVMPIANPIPAARFVASFTRSAAAAGKVAYSLSSFGNTTILGNTMPQIPIAKNSLSWHIKPPEGNVVMTFGAVENADDPSSLSMFIYNPFSYNFKLPGEVAPSAVNNPDWLPRPKWLYQYLPTWATYDSSTGFSPLGWASRRVYDIACHGFKQQTFRAPLMCVLDSTTLPGTSFWRPIRFYDPIYLDGEACIVRSVQIDYIKDTVQMATYTVESIFGAKLIYTSRVSPQMRMKHAIQKTSVAVVSESLDFPKHFTSEKRVPGQIADVLALGTIPIASVQAADGSFPYMADYDPLP